MTVSIIEQLLGDLGDNTAEATAWDEWTPVTHDGETLVPIQTEIGGATTRTYLPLSAVLDDTTDDSVGDADTTDSESDADDDREDTFDRFVDETFGDSLDTPDTDIPTDIRVDDGYGTSISLSDDGGSCADDGNTSDTDDDDPPADPIEA